MEDAYTQHGFELLRKMRQADYEMIQRMYNHDRWCMAHQHAHGQAFLAHINSMRYVHPNNQRRRFNGR